VIVLLDHNLADAAVLLRRALVDSGWLELVEVEIVTFPEISLPFDSDDRTVWRLAQARGMVLLTANRNMSGSNSLERTLREENTPASLPVLTVGNRGRIIERHYREACCIRLVEIALDLDAFRGVGRLYIP
jgi:hypothetical protein